MHLLTQKPDYTGSGFYLRALLKEAEKVGHKVGAVVGLGPGEQPDIPGLFPLRFESESLPFPVVGMSDVMPYRASAWSQLTEQQLEQYREEFGSAIREAVEWFAPDILHCHHLWLLTAMTRQLFPHKTVVASCHGTGLRQQAKLPSLASEIQPALESLQQVFFLTRAQQQGSGIAPELSTVVGAGFEPEIFYSEKHPKNSVPQVLFAGKLSFSKGCRELLQAVGLEIERGFRLSLAGAGHGDEGKLIAELAEKGGVKLWGRLPQHELAEVMRKSDVFVLPSYYEGLPLVLAEALACGCRLVVNNLPGLKEWLWPELLASGWVRLVDMPRLVHSDQPRPEDLLDYTLRLRETLLEQVANSAPPPPCLEDFLRSQTWGGVYRRISAHYQPGGLG